MAITRTAITDDSGSGTDGTIFNNAWKTELYDQIDALITALLAGSVSFGAALNVAGALTVTGALNANGALTVAGALTANGALTVAGLITATTGQIVFPATQNASAGVNTLDDYEEGAWTPTLISSGGGAPAYSAGSTGGMYVKVGQKAMLMGIITLTGVGTLAAGSVSIGGIPFTTANVSPGNGSGSFGYWANLAAAKVMVGYLISPNTTSVAITTIAAAATATASLAVTDLTATTQLVFTIEYRTTA